MHRAYVGLAATALALLLLVGMLGDDLFVSAPGARRHPAPSHVAGARRTSSPGRVPRPAQLEGERTAEAGLPASGSGASAAPARTRETRVLTGRVVDARGRPVPGVPVRFLRPDDRPDATPFPDVGPRSAPTDDDGRYRWVTSATGTWRACGHGSGVGIGQTEPFRVGPDGVASIPDLVLRGAGEVAGVVRFPDGTPVDRVSVDVALDPDRGGTWGPSPVPGLATGEGRTDDAGRFRIAGLRPGPVLVEVPGGGHTPDARVRAQTGDEDVEIVLRAHRIRVRVVGEDGRPLPGSDVGIRREVDGRVAHSRAPVQRADGCLDLFREPGVELAIAAHADGHRAQEAVVVVPVQPGSRDVVLALPADDAARGSLRLTYRRPDGAAVENVRVVLLTPRAESRWTRADDLRPDGEGIVRDVPPGRWLLQVWGDGNGSPRYAGFLLPARVEAEVSPGKTTDLWVPGNTGGRLRVELVRQGAEGAIRGATVEATCPATGGRRRFHVAAGAAEPGPLLEPGAWTVRLRGDDIEPYEVTVDVLPGRITDVEIPLVGR